MKLNPKQKEQLHNIQVIRAREFDQEKLSSMKGPLINGQENGHIIKLFLSSMKDDVHGDLASFVIVSPSEMPLAFFSLRCGELFVKSSSDKIMLSHKAYNAMRVLMSDKSTVENKKEAFNIVKRAKDAGLSVSDFEELPNKKESIKQDVLWEIDKDITRVLKVHPAIELKFYGINASAQPYWKSLGLPEDMRMGETLFWLKIVDKIRQMMEMVGCEYVYLFAADNEAEGELVQYYRVRLNFGSDSLLSANKPRFDYMSQFLFQKINDLFEKQKFHLDKHFS